MRLLHTFLVVLHFLPALCTRSSSQVWQWGRTGGGSGADSACCLAVTPDGDAVLVVSFQGGARFDGVQVASTGATGLAVLRYAPGGAIRWGAANGGSGVIVPAGVAVDRGGSAYVVGSFTRTISFGSTVLASNGGYDLFIARVSPSGSWVWARSGGGTENEVAGGVVVDSLDRPVIVGTFSQGARFDTAEIGAYGGSDILLAKYDPTGRLLWLVADGGPGDERGVDVGVDASGAISIVGEFDGRGAIAGADLGESALVDIAVGRYSGDGVPNWGRRIGSDSADHAGAIAVDPFGNITITGSCADSIDLGTHSVGGDGGDDLLVVRLNAQGLIGWGAAANGGASRGRDIAISPEGSVVLLANYRDSIALGPLAFKETGMGNALVAGLNSSGLPLWGDHNPVPGKTQGGGVAFDRNGEFYMAGSYDATGRFGSLVLPPPSSIDVFLVRHGADASVRPTVLPKKGPFCPGAVIQLPYTVDGVFFNDNLFRVEMSDSTGSFVSPTEIGRARSTGSGVIAATIPPNAMSGRGYRIRISATNPERASAATDSFIISPVPRPVLYEADTLYLCAGESATLDAGAGYVAYAWSTGATTQSIRVSQSGKYSVQVTNQAGCSGASAVVTVYVHAPIPPPVITRLTEYLLESTPADGYQWFVDGEEIPGERSRTLFIVKSGVFTVRVSYESGCTARSLPFVVQVASVESRAGEALAVRPTPASDRIELRATINVGDAWSAQLFDLAGRVLVRDQGFCLVDGSAGWLDLRSLPASVYILRVTINGSVRVTPVVVE